MSNLSYFLCIFALRNLHYNSNKEILVKIADNHLIIYCCLLMLQSVQQSFELCKRYNSAKNCTASNKLLIL